MDNGNILSNFFHLNIKPNRLLAYKHPYTTQTTFIGHMLWLYASLLYNSRQLKKKVFNEKNRKNDREEAIDVDDQLRKQSLKLLNNINYLQNSLLFRIPELFFRRFDLG